MTVAGSSINGGSSSTSTSPLIGSQGITRPEDVTIGDQGFRITTALADRWRIAFPAVDVDGEVRRAFEWLQANPRNRKRNLQRFLVNWLCKAQERAPARGGGHLPGSVNDRKQEILDAIGRT